MIFLENKTNSQLHIKQISQAPKHNIKRYKQQKRTFKNILADKVFKTAISIRFFTFVHPCLRFYLLYFLTFS